jgi:acetyl-CoA acetyltransferase
MVRSGEHDVVLALGVDKLTHEDKDKAIAAHTGGWDIHDGGSTFANLAKLAPNPKGESLQRRTAMMDVYSALARHHMDKFGTTQKQLAVIAAKNHTNSVHNEKSQYRNAMTADEVLAAREISWPLTLPMCSPISDGAAAAIVCNESAMRRLGLSRGVRIRAAILASGSLRDANDLDRHIVKIAADQAYERGAIGPDDIDVCEVHDATSFAELLHNENLGFCRRGDGGPFAERGATGFGGSIPINLSGGLVSRGHPVGATGLAQTYDLVRQLRGEAGSLQIDGARLALAENGGGFIGYEEAAACITILERVN